MVHSGLSTVINLGDKLTTASGRIRFVGLLAASGLLFVSFAWASGNTTSKGTAAKSTPPKKSAVSPTSKPAANKTSANRRRNRKEPFKVRLARLKLQPERVQEIQQALITQGYLNQDPTGKWDEATRSAMLRFQQDHGFPATGMPEAKSLMKLGLGPHPLPDELDPTAQVRAGIGPLAQPDSTGPASQE
jgi:peptidoglycan hydrolase-like protein with peptidoglycan-binding domain